MHGVLAFGVRDAYTHSMPQRPHMPPQAPQVRRAPVPTHEPLQPRQPVQRTAADVRHAAVHNAYRLLVLAGLGVVVFTLGMLVMILWYPVLFPHTAHVIEVATTTPEIVAEEPEDDLHRVPTGATSTSVLDASQEMQTPVQNPPGTVATSEETPEVPAEDTTNTIPPLPDTPEPEEPAVPDVPDPAPAKPEEKPETKGQNYKIGIAVGETLSVVSEAELKRRLDDMADLGVGWIRADLAWSTVERVEGQYEWGAFDAVVREANARDIKVLPILTYTPGWARRDTCSYTKFCDPEDPVAFARFARDATERYAPRGVHHWEIWNEPNIRLFWAAGAHAGRYTPLLQAAYAAIKQVDRGAFVVSGGLAPTATGNGNIAPLEFVASMYGYGAGEYFDALGFHPYSYPLSPTYTYFTNAWSQMAETDVSLRSIMALHGDGDKEMWLTEYGAPTGGPRKGATESILGWPEYDHVSEAYQAELLEEAFNAADSYAWAGPLFWYSYKDLGTSNNTKENHFGILRADGSTKPAYEVLRALR